eukprot:scaffold200764_cov39-Tisochrysis_lutea.AAC.2
MVSNYGAVIAEPPPADSPSTVSLTFHGPNIRIAGDRKRRALHVPSLGSGRPLEAEERGGWSLEGQPTEFERAPMRVVLR